MKYGWYRKVKKRSWSEGGVIFKLIRRWHADSRRFRLIEQSSLFDVAWYLSQPMLADNQSARRAPIQHYLKEGAAAGLAPGPDFDGVWYLRRYPDVADAGWNPLLHYLEHGKREGRLPRNNRALAWEHHLWRGADSVMLPRLVHLSHDPQASREEAHCARWALARWWAWRKDWALVRQYLLPDGRLIDSPTHSGPALLAVEALLATTQHDVAGTCMSERVASVGTDAPINSASNFDSGLPSLDSTDHASHTALLADVLTHLDQYFGSRADTALAHANATCDPSQRLSWINSAWQSAGLEPVGYRNPRLPLCLDNLGFMDSEKPALDSMARHTAASSSEGESLVSVILPAYNVAGTIATAIHGLFAQFDVRLELLVVDDASEDTTCQVVEALIAQCPGNVALHLLRHRENSGAYAARNTGLRHATGDLITVHDSDDWSHPQKLVRQVAALQAQAGAVASLSSWVRTTPTLHFHRWRVEEGWVYPNISSLMLRRSAIEALGGWDNVRVDADTEFHERLIARFGHDAVIEVLPGVPLAFGRADEASLSQAGTTHLVTRFVGVRQAYIEAARRWHSQGKKSGELTLVPEAPWRPFAAPAAICRQALPVRFQHPLDVLQASGLFAPGWYLRTHLDLQDVIIEPLAHYWQAGSQEGRDPGPHFSTSGYRYCYPDIGDQNPLWHYVTLGRREGRSPWPVLSGDLTRNEQSPCILLCGHQAGSTLFGAERSLLDVLKAMNTLGWNVVVSLPSAVNGPYIEALRAHSMAVAVLPYGWWQRGRSPEPATLRHFRGLIKRFKIDAVHVNTIVLHEPMIAARESGVPVIVHVRELPEHDSGLCQTLNAEASTVMARVCGAADLIIANSEITAEACRMAIHNQQEVEDDTSGGPSSQALPPITVVPNTIDMVPLLALALRNEMPVTLGMLSSNLPKKGLEDLVSVAAHLQRLIPELQIKVFGPRTSALDTLMARQVAGLVPSNILYAGYVDAPQEALAQLDIVVNLSHFQESFGRTVLEAMAAARPVVGYEWGALPELVVGGTTGYLETLSDTLSVAHRIFELAQDPMLRLDLGMAGRQRAKQYFDQPAMETALYKAYEMCAVL